MEKNFFLCKFWAVKNFYNLLKSAGEIFLSGLRGAKNVSNAFRIVFRIFFRVFQTVFRIDLKFFGGSFVLQTCRPNKRSSVFSCKVARRAIVGEGTWAMAVGRGSRKSLFFINSGRCSLHKILGPAPLQKCVGDFRINFGGFCQGFSWRFFFWALFPQKRGEKIRRQHPRKKLATQK